MTNKNLFDAIHQCDDKYLVEVLEEQENLSKNNNLFRTKYSRILSRRVACAIIICILIFSTGISVMAIASDTFREWLLLAFRGYEITEMSLENDKFIKDTTNNEPDIKVDKNGIFSLTKHMEIIGENESFVYEYHMNKEEQIVDKVYAIQGNGLKQLETSSFHGEYDGTAFSFEYAVINQDIYGFNCTGALCQVFHHINDDIVYANLMITKGSTVKKECIAALNLKTGEINKLTDDTMICNFVMSPNGKVILCNHRSEGYWSVLDLNIKTETKVPDIEGYAHTSEINFLDDYHILTLGKPFRKGKIECFSTYAIDLHNQKITEEYKDYGDINMRWTYTLKNNHLILHDITTGDSIVIENINVGHLYDDIQIIDVKDNYVLFAASEEDNINFPFYLVNLKKQSFKKIDMLKGFLFDIEMHLAAKEKKLLLTDGKKAYIVDVSKL